MSFRMNGALIHSAGPDAGGFPIYDGGTTLLALEDDGSVRVATAQEAAMYLRVKRTSVSW